MCEAVRGAERMPGGFAFAAPLRLLVIYYLLLFFIYLRFTVVLVSPYIRSAVVRGFTGRVPVFRSAVQ